MKCSDVFSASRRTSVGRRRQIESRRNPVVLDSGAVLLESRGNEQVRRYTRRAALQGNVLVVPAIVVSETSRGDGGTSISIGCSAELKSLPPMRTWQRPRGVCLRSPVGR